MDMQNISVFHDKIDERMSKKKFFRYVDYLMFEKRSVTEDTYYLEKETPAGFWITDKYGGIRKWVSNSGRKRFAYPSRKEAWHNFTCRKNKQFRILDSRAKSIEDLLQHIKEFEDRFMERGEE